jgi:hypothetical protein
MFSRFLTLAPRPISNRLTVQTDEFIVANDSVTGSALLLIQTLTSRCASNHATLLGRKWDVRGVVGVCLTFTRYIRSE